MSQLISVVIPVYNAENYIKDCLVSLQNQIDTEWEAIVVDDGSTDNSLEVCKQFAEADSRIRVFHQENGGVSMARNTGIRLSDGEFLMFADADDVLEDKMLQRMRHQMNENSVDLVVCGFTRVDLEGKLLFETTGEEKLLDLEEGLMEAFLNYNFQLAVWNKLYKKSIISERKIKFKEGLTHGEDGLWLCTYLIYCQKIYWDPTPYYQYRQIETSVTGQMGNQGKFDYKQLRVLVSLEKTAPLLSNLSQGVIEAYKLHYEGICIGMLLQAVKFSYEDKELYQNLLRRVQKYFSMYLASSKVGMKDKAAVLLAVNSPELLHYIYKKKK